MRKCKEFLDLSQLGMRIKKLTLFTLARSVYVFTDVGLRGGFWCRVGDWLLQPQEGVFY